MSRDGRIRPGHQLQQGHFVVGCFSERFNEVIDRMHVNGHSSKISAIDYFCKVKGIDGLNVIIAIRQGSEKSWKFMKIIKNHWQEIVAPICPLEKEKYV